MKISSDLVNLLGLSQLANSPSSKKANRSSKALKLKQKSLTDRIRFKLNSLVRYEEQIAVCVSELMKEVQGKDDLSLLDQTVVDKVSKNILKNKELEQKLNSYLKEMGVAITLPPEK